MKEHLYPVLALLAGIVVHMVKKGAQKYQADKTFSLWDYLLGHPYQTFLTFAAGGGLYLGLVSGDAVTLCAAFFAGVASNSLGDCAPGDR